jgi:ATP-dependent Clp protease ATP-binding subunit ClpC
MLPHFTARAVTLFTLAADRAKRSGTPNVTTGDLLHGMLAESANLGLRILTAMDISPATLTPPTSAEPSVPDSGALRFSAPASVAIELAVTEAIGLGHNYVGCEHLLIGLAGEPDGAAGTLLRAQGADGKSTRRAVATALAGYSAGYARVQKDNSSTAELLTAVRAELAPLVARIESLEARLN